MISATVGGVQEGRLRTLFIRGLVELSRENMQKNLVD